MEFHLKIRQPSRAAAFSIRAAGQNQRGFHGWKLAVWRLDDGPIDASAMMRMAGCVALPGCETAAMQYLPPALYISLGIAAAAACATAGEPGKSGAAPLPADQQVYRPTLSDLMNDVIQPRHTKLWLAGEGQNWMLAEYERHNINGAFARIAAAIPAVKGVQTAELITTFVTPRLTVLGDAIKARDENAFVAAYGALTEGCNACHQATGSPMVVIKSPAGDAFTDQSFGPGPAGAPSAK